MLATPSTARAGGVFRKIFGEDFVHLAILADVFQINLGVDNVFRCQPAASTTDLMLSSACRICAAKLVGKLPSGRRGPWPEM